MKQRRSFEPTAEEYKRSLEYLFVYKNIMYLKKDLNRNISWVTEVSHSLCVETKPNLFVYPEHSH